MGQLLSFSTTNSSPQDLKNKPNIKHIFDNIWRIIRKKLDNNNLSLGCESRGIDLANLPPELALTILSYLNATDLYLAACVWWNLASDEFLWQGLCRATWPFCSVYKTWKTKEHFSFRILFLRLDEARLTFNGDAFEGIRYLQHHEILNNEVSDLAAFLHSAPRLDRIQKRRFLETRQDVLDELILIKNVHQKFLPDALRNLFVELSTPEKGPLNFVDRIIERFSEHFVQCNPSIGLPTDVVYILCFSLIMLSVDFSCPKIKNKMSKREFIRNTRQAAPNTGDEFLGHLYDNVYIEGDIGAQTYPQATSLQNLSSTHRSTSPNGPFRVLTPT